MPTVQQNSLIRVSLSEGFRNLMEQVCAHAQYSDLLKRIIMSIQM